MRTPTIVFITLLVLVTTAVGSTIHVPADQPTIQAGIDAALESDTVLVAPGTYTGDGNRDIDFGGKNLILVSENGPEVTIIDCEGSVDEEVTHRGFVFTNGETSSSVVSGFTITHGVAAAVGGMFSPPATGGAVICRQSSPGFDHCIFVYNAAAGVWPESAPGHGGAIYCEDSEPVFSYCLMISNYVASNGRGGAVYCQNATPVLRNCTLVDNHGPGAALWVAGSSNPILENCLIAYNYSIPVGSDGTGDAQFFCTDIFGHAIFDWYGFIADQAGINGNMWINPDFCDLEAGDYRVGDASPCVPENNSCGDWLGALGVGCSTIPKTYYVAVDGDDLSGDGSYDYPFATIQRGIDACLDYDEVVVLDGTYTGDGNRDLDFGGRQITVRSENGPVAVTIDCESEWEDQHRAFEFSNGETANSVVDGLTIINGNSGGRSGGAIYVGPQCGPTIRNCVFTQCYAFKGGAVFYVEADISVLNCEFVNNGSMFGGAICCKKSAGTISGNTMTLNWTYGGIGTHGGALYFDSCDVDVVGNTVSQNWSEAFGGAISSRYGNLTIHNNQITDNYLPETSYWGAGAGIYTEVTDVTITDNVITGNHLGRTYDPGMGGYTDPMRGGGIYVYRGTEVIISGNEVSGNRGGGIECYAVTGLTVSDNTVSSNNLLQMWQYDGRLASAGIEVGQLYSQACSQVTISNNVCIDNGAYTGGGILCYGHDVVISGCRLEANRGREGGGIYLKGDNITVSDCVVESNFATGGYGGGIAAVECNPTIENCTIVGNRSGTARGAALLVRDGAPSFANCIVANHTAGTLIECQSDIGSAAPIFSHCDIFGNAEGNWVGCIANQANISGNFSADPQFCDVENGNYHLSVLSPCAATNNSSGQLIGALEPSCGYYECGDVDLDGELTEADIEALFNAYYHTLPTYFPTLTGDMDCSGTITLSDLILLSGYYYGYGPEPCCAPPPKRPDLPTRDANGGPIGQ